MPQNNEAFTLIAARSLAENTRYSREVSLSPALNAVDGQLEDMTVVVTGIRFCIQCRYHSIRSRVCLDSMANTSSPSD